MFLFSWLSHRIVPVRSLSCSRELASGLTPANDIAVAELMSTAFSNAADGSKPELMFLLPVLYHPSRKYCRAMAPFPATIGVDMLVPLTQKEKEKKRGNKFPEHEVERMECWKEAKRVSY